MSRPALPSALVLGLLVALACPAAAMAQNSTTDNGGSSMGGGGPVTPPGGPIPPPPAAHAVPAPAPAAPQTTPETTPTPEATQPPGERDLSLDVAVLGALDKVTARVVTIKAPVNRPVHFGTLEIIARACKKHPPEESPESAAFLDIWDLKPNQPAQSVFRGWMFASSPALSAMESPIYDIWVLDCRDDTAAPATKKSP